MRTLNFIPNSIEAFKDLLGYWPSLIYTGIAEEPGGSKNTMVVITMDQVRNNGGLAKSSSHEDGVMCMEVRSSSWTETTGLVTD